MSQLKTEAILMEKSMEWFVSKTNDMFLLMDTDGKVKYVNPSLLRMLQTTYSDIMDQSFLNFTHWEDKNKVVERLLLLPWHQSFVPFTSRCWRKDGTYCTMHWSKAELSERGFIQVIAQSVAENHKERQMERTPADVWRSAFFDHTDDPAIIIDMDGRVILGNQAFEKAYDWKLKERGDKIYTIINQTQSEFIDLRNRILNGERVVNHQIISNGSVCPLSLTVSPIYDDSIGITCFSVIAKSLKELQEGRLLVEMQNKVIEEGDRLLLDITKNISEVICLYDMEKDKVLYISPSIEKKWGISVTSFYENPIKSLDCIHIVDRRKVIESFRSTSGLAKKMEYAIKDTKSGELSWVRTKITPIFNDEGIVTRHLSISEDITELKEQSKQVRQLDNLGLIGQMAAGIAHEIRNPITSVKGFIQLLSEETDHKYSDIITSEIERIESIMNEFLVLAKPAKEVKLVKENINNVIQEVISFMGPEALLHTVEIKSELSKDIMLVNCASKQIKQVIINLIKNAIDAMPSGGAIHVNTTTMPNGMVVIEIRDEGMGISNEQLEHLREPFYSDKATGTGLGLMISYKIIEDHNGTIQFLSKVGEGTSVQILLPSAA
ncbi:ATP-binding protein [Bacillus sp. FSL K6-3431]|uniref:ATP-binding protein n=1 Tax=Bacillus sp. FSL K6-3431 TaxID=2921500 RepID=UPI0030FA40DF